MSDFMGGSILSWILLFLIIFLLLAFPFIIAGYFVKRKDIFYAALVWIAGYITLEIFSIQMFNSGLKSFIPSIHTFGRYIPLYVVGLLLGSYVGRNNQKWKLGDKLSTFLTVIQVVPLKFPSLNALNILIK